MKLTKFIGANLMTLAVSSTLASGLSPESAPCSTHVAKWSGDASAAFVLFYDDGCQSTFSFAVPALKKHNVHGTFYLCCGWFDKNPEQLVRWFDAAKDPNIFIGNHTWSHSGAKNLEDLETEVEKNDSAIRKALSLPATALVSFATPGGVPWVPSHDELKRILLKYGLRSRTHDDKKTPHVVMGSNVTTFKEAVPYIDAAEKTGTLEALLFHGVGGDWFKFSAADHEKLIRELAVRQAKGTLWIPAMIEADKYIAERESAKVSSIASSDGKAITVSLELTTDPAIYDYPLTLVTSAAEDWECVDIEQNGSKKSAPVLDGRIVYEVAPMTSTITISRK